MHGQGSGWIEPTDARGAGWCRGAMGAHCLRGLPPPRWPWGASWPAILPKPLQQHVRSALQRLRRGPLVTKHRTGCLDSYVQPWWQRHLGLGELHPRGLHRNGGSEVSIHSPCDDVIGGAMYPFSRLRERRLARVSRTSREALSHIGKRSLPPAPGADMPGTPADPRGAIAIWARRHSTAPTPDSLED